MQNSPSTSEDTVTVNSVPIFYKIIGAGEPVVIVHGGPGFDHIHMLPFAELADEFKTVFYDQRGTGNSGGSIDASSITVANFVEDLEALRVKLDLKKMHLIGHSWGAVLSLFYATAYPQNLEKLILLSAYASAEVFAPFFTNIQKNTTAADASAMQEIERSAAFQNRETAAIQQYYRLAMKPFCCDPAAVERIDLSFGKNTAANQQDVASLLMQNIGTFDIHDQLAVIKCPTLIVHGVADPLPWEGAYKVHQHIAHSKLVMLENTGHFLFAESPTTLFATIRKFLHDDAAVATAIPQPIAAKL